MTLASAIIYTGFAIESLIVYSRTKNGKIPNPKAYCKNPQFIMGGVLQLV